MPVTPNTQLTHSQKTQQLVSRMKRTGAGVRLLSRHGHLQSASDPAGTSGLARGRVQTNLAFVPLEHADDFASFCRANSVPCPLVDRTLEAHALHEERAFHLARLTPGDTAFAFANTDAPSYRVFRDGVAVADVPDLAAWARESASDEGKFVAFAIGCSFTFESALIDEGLPVAHVDAGRNVPMYRTSIPLHPSGAFGGSMVVSMRPFALGEEVERACAVSARYPSQHGGPVHVGDPAAIGVADLASPEFGDAPTDEVLSKIADGTHVPLFWGCGVTPQVALENARLPLACSHSPGFMMVADVMCADTIEDERDGEEERVASLLPPSSSAGLPSLAMEQIVLHGDVRGMCELHAHPRGLNGEAFLGVAADVVLGAILNSIARNETATARVAVLTGFYIERGNAPETDGPPGAAALLRGLERIPGVVGVAVTDELCEHCVRSTCDGADVKVIPMDESEARFACARVAESCDLLICVERPGPDSDGRCRNMRGVEMSGVTARTDLLCDAFAARGCPIVAVGDGGNELGMGNCISAIQELPSVLPHAGGCVVGCDALVVCAASNYGCYGLLASLSLRVGEDLLPLEGDASADVVRSVNDGGAVDGTTARAEATVDGRPLDDTERCVRDLRSLLSALLL